MAFLSSLIKEVRRTASVVILTNVSSINTEIAILEDPCRQTYIWSQIKKKTNTCAQISISCNIKYVLTRNWAVIYFFKMKQQLWSTIDTLFFHESIMVFLWKFFPLELTWLPPSSSIQSTDTPLTMTSFPCKIQVQSHFLACKIQYSKITL